MRDLLQWSCGCQPTRSSGACSDKECFLQTNIGEIWTGISVPLSSNGRLNKAGLASGLRSAAKEISIAFEL
ncbi:hypothetical protein PC129_g6171 [Phytophthora cactorum]|uniref:Uncharacterized protein n=1 Tax=Phytophthora cactorum TaxID=29920 RepID=A0A8T0ZAS4_9STRA|nr:hypothetical protein Pcac1_g12358 [Phytophthora cactorum]KAG2830555.1 hypothetical protein PC112_g7636 [Phytophthora cactorum]KAG2832041.1 hypothetical protein PC111_g6760 [Phytophthora cactorum]KAG2859715.1 hypothetical protein PC113_g8673 [Phytophthora cactorum]KAG2914504.1 hypothetical protein PC114_g8151 [Phytophthora cactorum]